MVLLEDLWAMTYDNHPSHPIPTHIGAVHILRNTLWGGGGLPDLLQYYIGGVVKIYYNITVLKGKWKVIILFQL